MATNFLKFCSMGSTNGVAFGDGVLGVDCVAREGRMCTDSGLFLLGQWTFGALLFLPFHCPPQLSRQ